jgi:hypothetical protein
MTEEDRDDLALLSLQNDKHKFAIEVGYASAATQLALERAFDNDWVRLIDVTMIAVARNRLMRVFKLTQAGLQRLYQLQGMKV